MAKRTKASRKASKAAARSASARRARRRSAQVEDRYEAAFSGYFGDRSWLPAAVQDSRFDADAATRLELLRRARYWEKNSWIVARLAHVFAQYTVGTQGLQIVPTGEDEGWIASASNWFEDWAKQPSLDSALPFRTLQSIMARTWFIQGEVFIYKTFSRASGRPRIQLIEPHRVGTPPHLRDQEGKSIIDGLEFATDPGNGQPTGRPLFYWLRTDPAGSMLYGPAPVNSREGGNWERIPAERIIHLYEPERPGMVRGLTSLYPIMTDLHDLSDLQWLEMKAAKSNAEVANVVTNKPGEANLAAARRQKWQIQSQDKNGNPANKTAPLFYEVTVGGRTVYMATGEKFEQFKSERPSVATKEFWDYLVHKIALGTGMSPVFIDPGTRMQGTVARADQAVSSTYFKSRVSPLAGVMGDIYVWALDWGVRYDRSLDGAPEHWWHHVIRPPRSVDVDVGRNSRAILDELEGGIRTYQDVCAELGHDWRHVLREKAVEAKYINSLVDEFGVTRDQIAMLANATFRVSETMQMPKEAQETLYDQEDEPKKQPEPANAAPITVNLENQAAQTGRRTIRIARDNDTGDFIVTNQHE